MSQALREEQRDSAVNHHDERDWVTTLEALLALSHSVDPRAGVEGVAEQCLVGGAALLSEMALGLVVVDATSGTRITRVHLPEGSHAPQEDPTRLFPCFAHELVLPLKGLTGSSLHLASNEQEILPGSFEHGVASRLSQLCARLLGQAQMLERSPNAMQMVQRLKTRLVQAEKLASLGQVVTGVVHELATPLTAIVSYSGYLREKTRKSGGDDSDIERLNRISDSAQRILEFTRDLVAYARPSMRVPATVDLHQIIDKALVFCDHELSNHRVEAQLRLDAARPLVLGTQSALTQIFVNLVVNAAQAMQQGGGSLRIKTENDDDAQQIVVKVSDQGSGIPSEVLPHIFDAFFTTKPEREGTGLGLAIVREILQGHRGSIEVHSTVGVGTTFVLRFPSARGFDEG